MRSRHLIFKKLKQADQAVKLEAVKLHPMLKDLGKP